MITKNFKKIIKAFPALLMLSTNKTGLLDSIESVNGSQVNIANITASAISNNFALSFRSAQSSAGFTFGTGTTPATEDDRDLKAPIYASASTFQGNSITYQLRKDGTKYYFDFMFNLVNKSANPITINEIGLISTSYSTSSVNTSFLVDRTVLDEPIVLPADNTPVPVKYSLCFDWDI